MGGGVIGAAAKVAGFSAGGIRGIAVPSVTRRAATLRPATSAVDEIKFFASNSEGTAQSPSSAIDDWVVFAAEEEDTMVNSAGSMPRVVFGALPSLQEAKEATSELTAALDKAYLSSPTSAESEGSSSGLHRSNTQLVEANNVGSEITNTVSLPSPTIMAFQLLKESPVAQNVVASIASDRNVWNAVLQNEELQGFLLSQRTCFTSSDVNSTAMLVEDSKVFDESSAATTIDSSEDGNSGPAGGFMDVFEKIKGAVVNMMNGLSDFFVNLFGGKGANAASANSDGDAKFNTTTMMEASFLGLGIMAILLILLKRG